MSQHALIIPGRGWDIESIVWGYVKFEGAHLIAGAREVIAAYSFDDTYPFTNIFWPDSTAQYGAGVIGFAGSYKQIEEDWSEWLWKFADLLSLLPATEARVSLDCIIGNFHWKLKPEPSGEGVNRWYIAQAPEKDFTINPDWIAHCDSRWDRFVRRDVSK